MLAKLFIPLWAVILYILIGTIKSVPRITPDRRSHIVLIPITERKFQLICEDETNIIWLKVDNGLAIEQKKSSLYQSKNGSRFESTLWLDQTLKPGNYYCAPKSLISGVTQLDSRSLLHWFNENKAARINIAYQEIAYYVLTPTSFRLPCKTQKLPKLPDKSTAEHENRWILNGEDLIITQSRATDTGLYACRPNHKYVKVIEHLNCPIIIKKSEKFTQDIIKLEVSYTYHGDPALVKMQWLTPQGIPINVNDNHYKLWTTSITLNGEWLTGMWIRDPIEEDLGKYKMNLQMFASSAAYESNNSFCAIVVFNSTPDEDSILIELVIALSILALVICSVIIYVYVLVFDKKKPKQSPLVIPDRTSRPDLEFLLTDVRMFEFPSDRLSITNDILAEETHGIVFRGHAIGIRPHVDGSTVAIKTPRQRHINDNIRAMLAEKVTMAHIGIHENVVQLLGTVSANIALRELYVITEFCELGGLQRFLEDRRDAFVDTIDGGCDSLQLTTAHLIAWSRQAARGMAYLGSRNVVHRDVAARHCFLDRNRILKIGHFELARVLSADGTYHAEMDERLTLPNSWMAIESMSDLCFSTSSDVWSFGVVLWEIFRLGETPFACVPTGRILEHVQSGQRLQKPPHASQAIYELMSECWSVESCRRPKFDMMEKRLA